MTDFVKPHDLFVVAERMMSGLQANEGSVMPFYRTKEEAQKAAEDVIEDLNDGRDDPEMGYEPDSWVGVSLHEIDWIGDHIEEVSLPHTGWGETTDVDVREWMESNKEWFSKYRIRI